VAKRKAPSRTTGAPAPGAALHGPVTIVSSEQLSQASPETSELEFGLIMAGNAFSRWVVRCMAAAGLPDLTTLDVLVLHHVHHRGRPKKTADICFVLNVEDTHTVTYSLKKLIGLDVIASDKQGKEVLYTTTAGGRAVVERYREIREACLIPSIADGEHASEELRQAAQVLRTLSGIYDQAARAAASL
jgi:predicted MarR family transcription regulator